MIVPTLILVSTLVFLARLMKLKFPNTTKKLLLQLKTLSFSLPMPPNSSSSCSLPPTLTNTMNNDAKLKQIFDTFDKNGDGFISRQELLESLKNIGILLQDKEVEDMVKNLDSNNDGLIDVGEFKKLFEMVEGRSDEGNKIGEDNEDDEGDLKEAFDVFDGDKDGLITVEELGLVLSSLGLKEGKRIEACREMISKVDVDGDGMVNFDEFKRMMKAGGGVSFLLHV